MTFLEFFWQPGHYPTVLIALALATALLYLLLAATSSVLFSLLGKGNHELKKSIYPRQIGKALRWSALNIAGNAILTAAVVVAIANGHSQVYYSVSEYGWTYLVLSALALLFFTETLVYWIHRGLHYPLLYRTLHKYHHEFRAPTSWASMAFHPLDSFAQAAPYHLFVFLFPTWVGLYAGALIMVTLWTFMIHDETLALLRGQVINFTSHHVLHHTCNKYNYGQFLTFWDRLAKTHRAP